MHVASSFRKKKKILASDNPTSSAMLPAIMFFYDGQERPRGDATSNSTHT
jgi:hypothetical protein